MKQNKRPVCIFYGEEVLSIDVGDDSFTSTSKKLIGEIDRIISNAFDDELITKKAKLSAACLATINEAKKNVPQDIYYGADRSICFPHQGIPLKGVTSEINGQFIKVLNKRKTKREFGKLSFESLSNLLFHGARVRDYWEATDGFTATSRAAPSAGARHSIHLICIVNDVIGLASGGYYFDPFHAVLIPLEMSSSCIEIINNKTIEKLQSNTPPPTTIYFIAQIKRTLSRYPKGITFVYRDSGALLTTLYFVATALGLAVCGIGSSAISNFNDEMKWPFPEMLEVGGIAIGSDLW